jgi:hypothetical protein
MGKRGWLILAVVVNAIFASISQAQTNSWSSSTDGFWQESNLWSLAEPPAIDQSAILITNAASVAITIDAITASNYTSTLTIGSLTITPPSGSTETLYLVDTGVVALHILDGLTLGISIDGSATGGSVLISTNSTLVVDGVLGGQLQDNGTMVIAGGVLITTNCSLQVAPQTFSFFPSVGLFILSNGIAQARDVTVGIATVSGSSGMLEVLGGTMNLSASLTMGDGNGDPGGGNGNLLVANEGRLVITNDLTRIESGTLTVTNASFLGETVLLGGFRSAGELVINQGTVTLSGELDVATGDVSDGSVTLNGGMLVVTNDTVYLGSDSSNGHFTVLDGVFLGQAVVLQRGGFLSIQGGTSILSSDLVLEFDAPVTVCGGQLIVTNAPIYIDGGLQCTVSGGSLAANTFDVGVGESANGALSVSGGSVTVSAGITLGDCASNEVGQIFLSDGELIVTNRRTTGFIDVRNGQVNVSGGVLQVDRLVMTNTCSSLVHTAGTLIVGSVVLDPNAFAITSIAREGSDFRITWLMAPGQINALQASCGGTNGSYTTNGFTDIFIVTNNTTTGTLTNYLDFGAATNFPSRFYRARLAP